MKRRKFIARTSSVIAGIPFINKELDGSLNSVADADDIKEYLSRILYKRRG